MASVQHDSALEEAAIGPQRRKGVKMSDILAATEREEAKKRKLPELYHRSDTSVDAGLASTAPTGAKLERKDDARARAGGGGGRGRQACERPPTRPPSRRGDEQGGGRGDALSARRGRVVIEFALVDEGGALRFKTDKKPVAAPPKVDHTAALLKEASSGDEEARGGGDGEAPGRSGGGGGAARGAGGKRQNVSSCFPL